MNIRLLSLFVVLTVSAAGAATIHVPVDHASVGLAVAAAADGDTVQVAAGTYSGAGNHDIQIDGMGLVLIAPDGPELTIIDCQGLGLGFNIRNGADVHIEGFTILNASGGNGSAVVVYQSTAVIASCVFELNSVSMNAGAVWIGYTTSSSSVLDCEFRGNTSVYRAGALMIDHAEAQIARCLFVENTAGTLGGGAMHFNSSTATVDACILMRNDGGAGAGGIEADSSIATTVSNTIIAFSSAGAAANGGIYTHCIAWNNLGGNDLGDPVNNLAVDPLFCNPEGDDFLVCADSPALSGSLNNPWGEDVGFLGQGCAACSGVANEDLSWSDVKTLFR